MKKELHQHLELKNTVNALKRHNAQALSAKVVKSHFEMKEKRFDFESTQSQKK